MSYVLLLSRPVLSRPLSSETLVWLLSAVAYSDLSTTSQAEVQLERIHAFYWEMGPFTLQSPSDQSIEVFRNEILTTWQNILMLK